MAASRDQYSRRRSRVAIETLSGGERDYYCVQLADLVHALASPDTPGRPVSAKANGLMHLLASPPPCGRAVLDAMVDGRSLRALLREFVRSRRDNVYRGSGPADDPPEEYGVPEAPMRLAISDALARIHATLPADT